MTADRTRIITRSHPGLRFVEARVPGKLLRCFYWNDLPSRRLRPEILTSEQALEQAKRWQGRSRTCASSQLAFCNLRESCYPGVIPDRFSVKLPSENFI